MNKIRDKNLEDKKHFLSLCIAGPESPMLQRLFLLMS